MIQALDEAFRADTSIHQHLSSGLVQMGLDPDCAPRLLSYLATMWQWNQTYNLTAIKEPHAMIQRHVLDALAIHPFIAAGQIADLGSGAGLPGVPLAIACPNLNVDLIESNGKKVRFLRTVVQQLQLNNVRVIHQRIEAVDALGHYDYLVARALCRLTTLVTVSGGLLRPSGRILAMKGVFPTDEIAELPSNWLVAAVQPLTVPGLNEQRHLVVLVPSRYDQTA